MTTEMRPIPVCEPWFDDAEARCVNDALARGEISGFRGEYLQRFEAEFAAYCGCAHGVATSSGTSAIHLALATLGIGPGDEVLAPTLTSMATFFAILYQGATPVPVDIDPRTLNLDPQLLRSKLTPRTRAILVVHLFGHPCDMDPVLALAREHGLFVVEDCAEAHGASYRGRKVGGLGDMGCFSFYASKIITTGEGGMVTTSGGEWADRARNLRGLAFGAETRYQHRDIGFNHRMTNLQAALGHAQFGKIERVIAAKRRIAAYYAARLAGRNDLELPVEEPYARSVYWMYHVRLAGGAAGRRAEVMQGLAARGIESREGFLPFNLQEIFIARGLTRRDECPKANDVAERGFYLPTGPRLTDDELDYVAANLQEVLGSP